MKWLQAMFDNMEARLAKQIADSEKRIIGQLTPKPQPELTAGDILKHKEQKSSGRKPWRVIQREAELESSPEIQREKRIEQEKKEIANA